MEYEVEVDEDTCIGCGACVAICPDVYEMNDNGKSVAKTKKTDKECAKEASDSCPVSAIKIKEI